MREIESSATRLSPETHRWSDRQLRQVRSIFGVVTLLAFSVVLLLWVNGFVRAFIGISAPESTSQPTIADGIWLVRVATIALPIMLASLGIWIWSFTRINKRNRRTGF